MAKTTITPRKKYDDLPETGEPGTQFESFDTTPSTNNVHNPKLLSADQAWGISVGDAVHFVDEQGVHRAAEITAVRVAESCEVDLAVYKPIVGDPAIREYERVIFDASGKTRGTWHWIEGTVLNPR